MRTMQTICVSALVAFFVLTAMLIVGRAVDQVHKDAECITITSSCQQTP